MAKQCSKAEIEIFWKFFLHSSTDAPSAPFKKKISKALILVLPPKIAFFSDFRALCTFVGPITFVTSGEQKIVSCFKMSLFDGVKDVFDKVFNVDSINIDNFVCKLHYRVTVTILVVFSVLLSLGQLPTYIIVIFYTDAEKSCFLVFFHG